MRQRYVITPADYPHARDYLEMHEIDVQGGTRKHKAGKLNAWAEENLSGEEWRRLKAAIRKRRQRLAQGDSIVNIAISRETHDRLSRKASRDNVTLDEALRRLLKR